MPAIAPVQAALRRSIVASSRIPDAYHSRARAASNSTRLANLACIASAGNGSGSPNGANSIPNLARSSAGRYTRPLR